MNKLFIYLISLGIASPLLSADVTIIGSNYVGLATAGVLSHCGHKVICVDIDQRKINVLLKGQLPIYEPGLEHYITQGVENGLISFTTDLKEAAGSPIIYIAVGTPTAEDGSCECSALYHAIAECIKLCKGKKVLCVKSTVPPGTCRNLQKYLKENNRTDIELVFNPEFMRQGSAIEDILTKNPLVVASDSENAMDTIVNLYTHLKISGTPLIKTNFETAELIKYAWNSFSALRIAYVNELAELCTQFSGDIATLVKAMALSEVLLPTEIIKPGPGYGGSCLPKDTKAFATLLKLHAIDPSLIAAVIQSNNLHKQRIIKTIKEANDNDLKNKVVAILGLSFKANTDDIRFTPAIDVIEALIEEGAIIQTFDPQAMDHMKQLFPNLIYATSAINATRGAHCIVALTDWSEIQQLDLVTIAQNCITKILIDPRNIFNPKTMQALGFKYFNLGR